MRMGNDSARTIQRRRLGPWLPHLAAALIVAGIYFYGVLIYGGLPETVPTHWGSDGTPDGLMALASAAAPAMTHYEPKDSAWDELRRRGNIAGTVSALGVCSLIVAVVIGTLTVAGWRTPELVPIWPALTVMPLVLAALPACYGWETRRALQAARNQGINPTDEEAAEEAKWIAGILYNDEADPRVLVSKRRGSGMGMTINIGNRAGRTAVVVFLIVCALLPVAATVGASL
ncbi:DUF1648 domain-containing protein [Arthrobacter sp. NPDC055585]